MLAYFFSLLQSSTLLPYALEFPSSPAEASTSSTGIKYRLGTLQDTRCLVHQHYITFPKVIFQRIRFRFQWNFSKISELFCGTTIKIVFVDFGIFRSGILKVQCQAFLWPLVFRSSQNMTLEKLLITKLLTKKKRVSN